MWFKQIKHYEIINFSIKNFSSFFFWKAKQHSKHLSMLLYINQTVHVCVLYVCKQVNQAPLKNKIHHSKIHCTANIKTNAQFHNLYKTCIFNHYAYRFKYTLTGSDGDLFEKQSHLF